MKTSAAGLALIERFEGLRLRAYQDGNGAWTIGFGHTGPDVHAGDFETREHAEADLVRDVAGAEAAVKRLVRAPLTQGQFDALVSFVYNEGQGRLERSAILAALNSQPPNYTKAADAFRAFETIAGHKAYGLAARREFEIRMFLGQPIPA